MPFSEVTIHEQYPHKKIKAQHELFLKLILELQKYKFPAEIDLFINERIEQVNTLVPTQPSFKKEVKKHQNDIIKHLAKELRLVPKKFYEQNWFPLGMALFGIPIGIVISSFTGQVANIGIGLPIGLIIGLFIGKKIDQKAEKEKRQFNFEYKL